MTWLLALLASLGPFSIDAYLPSFHDLGQSLNASPLEVQQTLTAYLLPFAFMSLWHGAISDAFGRRRIILYALVLFGLASFGCATVTRIEQLWILRAAQGMSAGAGVVIGRAIVRDLFSGAQAQRLMAQVSMTFAFAPAVAPFIGGWLQTWMGWRAVFYFLALLTILIGIASWRYLPETLPPDRRQSLHPAYLVRSYWQVLSNPAFLAATLAMTCNFSGFFLYPLSAPFFLVHQLGCTEREFLWLFGPAMAGMSFGSWLSAHRAGKTAREHTLRAGFAIMGLAASGNLAFHFFLPPSLPWSVLPIFIYTVGMALTMPTLTLLALDLFPEQRGLAASCQFFLQSAANALIAGILAPILWKTAFTLALGMAGLVLLGALFCSLYGRFAMRHASP